MKANVFSLDGKKLKQVELPRVFDTEYRPDLIKRAVLSIQSARLQPKGTSLLAGRYNTAMYVGCRRLPEFRRTINVGRARKPRLKNRRELLYGRVADIPGAVAGPRAHPPRVERVLLERINKKEKRLATKSAIACTARKDLVIARGNELPEGIELPVIIEERIEDLSKTKDVLNVLKALKLVEEVEKAKEKKRVRHGKGKARGRKYKKKKSLLFVVAEKKNLVKAARNLEGVDVINARDLNAKVLAPGALPGRLSIYSEQAIELLGKGF